MQIYDANNCQRFIDKIKKMNKKMHRVHRKSLAVNSSMHGLHKGYVNIVQDDSAPNSARLIQLNKLR